MLNQKKIAMMTRLAIYDKKNGVKDRKITEYFLHDYVCKENMWNRFFVFLGSVILILISYVNRLFVLGEDFFSMNFRQELIDCVTFIILIWVVYSLVGFLKYNYEYNISYRRLRGYKIILNKINKYSEDDKTSGEG